jgi:TrmH family RNA methyltransferase
MEAIISSDNSKLKHVKRLLSDKEYRRGEGLFVCEGARWIRDAFNFLPGLFRFVFINEACRDKFKELADVIGSSIGADKIFSVSENAFNKISDTENSQGILAVLNIPEVLDLSKDKILFLDGIRDPGNAGTIIRTAVAAGFSDIILKNCSDVFAPKAVRSTMSALIKANIVALRPIERLKSLKSDGYRIFAADMNGQNVFTMKEKFDKIVLCIGSEADGISGDILALSDKTLSIPMQNTESLNAAVSAGILMYNLGGFSGRAPK